MTAGGWRALSRSLAAFLVAVPAALVIGVPAAQAKNGETNFTGIGLNQRIDCNESTLIVLGSDNTVNALGTCWAVP